MICRPRTDLLRDLANAVEATPADDFDWHDYNYCAVAVADRLFPDLFPMGIDDMEFAHVFGLTSDEAEAIIIGYNNLYSRLPNGHAFRPVPDTRSGCAQRIRDVAAYASVRHARTPS